MTTARTAVEELRRHIELAQEALSVSDHVARSDPSTAHDAMTLGINLKHEIDDMRIELAELERRPTGREPARAINLDAEHDQRRSRDRRA